MNAEEIQAIFFVECEEALAAAEAGLNACRDGTADGETINSIFRSVHSIKGGAGAFGFTALQTFTHGFETLLSDVRDGLLTLDDPLTGLLLRALDLLCDHVAVARNGGTTPADAAILVEMEAALATAPSSSSSDTETPAAACPAAGDEESVDPLDLDSLLDDLGLDTPPLAETNGSAWRVGIQPHPASLTHGSEPLLLLRELERIGGKVVAVDTSDVPGLAQFDPAGAWLRWTFAVPATVARETIEEIFDFCGDEITVTIDTATDAVVEQPAVSKTAEECVAADPSGEAAATPVSADTRTGAPTPAPAPAPSGQSIRIDLAKLDRLIDTVGELVIAQAMMAQRLSLEGLGGIDEIGVLDGLTRDIQESAMGIRAQPIGSVFSRVPRTLRELEGATGKQVRLEMAGEATELDKTVLERLGEPLTHLIRNAVDHGIEPAAERLAAGKPAQGVLRLSAEQRSGRIIITVADDGRGIDRERVLAKAVERNLVSPDAMLSDEEIDNLIFAPGFSTAEAVSTVSGRGVGMDVVRQNVKDLGGRISIVSSPGEGSVFSLALPLTLAISDGMIVTVGDQTLVVPLTHVIESLRPTDAEVAQMGAGRSMLNVRGNFIPVVSVAQAMGAQGAVASPVSGVLIVVDTESAGQAALQVDAICDQRQFVIKSLATHYRSVPGVAGATILGNGSVALIVDVDGMVANALADPQLAQAA